MASATSSISKVRIYTGNAQQRRNRRGSSTDSYYKTDVTILADGGTKRETFRTDANGNNAVKIQESTVDRNGTVTNNTTLSTATAGETKALQDPKSPLKQSVKSQVQEGQKKLKANSAVDKSNGDKAAGGSGNQAAADPATTAPKRVNAQDVNAAIGANKAGTRNKFPMTLTYPLSLRDSKQDKIQFNMIEYVPGEIGQGQLGINRTNAANVGSEAGSGSKSDKTIGRVFLPIPSGISDTTGAGWGEDRMNAAQLATAGAALGFIEQGGGGLVKSIEDTLNSVSAYSDDVKKAIATQVAGSASGTGPGLLTRTTGAVLNPNLELLFQGPTLRPFDFTFKLSARSQRESDDIIKIIRFFIIRFFKQGMAPIRSQSNLFLKSPHTFKIRYLHDNKDHPFLNKFKICALKSLTVNYTPDGNYATFRDGKMVSYELNMSFQELDPIFNDDYPQDDDKSIGF
jgi:hypothetical protein